MVETVTESISRTKDEWIQQFLLDKARNDYNCYAAAREKTGFARGREQGERIGMERGEKIGREQGERIGREQGILLTAKRMKSCNIDVDLICEITGLSISEISAL